MSCDEGLDVSDYIVHLERHFCIWIAPAEVEAVQTLGDMTDLISRKLAEAGATIADEAVWVAVRRISSEELGVDASELHRGIRFVEDLCC